MAKQKFSAMHDVSHVTLCSTSLLISMNEPCSQPWDGAWKRYSGSRSPEASEVVRYSCDFRDGEEPSVPQRVAVVDDVALDSGQQGSWRRQNLERFYHGRCEIAPLNESDTALHSEAIQFSVFIKMQDPVYVS